MLFRSELPSRTTSLSITSSRALVRITTPSPAPSLWEIARCPTPSSTPPSSPLSPFRHSSFRPPSGWPRQTPHRDPATSPTPADHALLSTPLHSMVGVVPLGIPASRGKVARPRAAMIASSLAVTVAKTQAAMEASGSTRAAKFVVIGGTRPFTAKIASTTTTPATTTSVPAMLPP